MSALYLIPARGGSKGIPGKNYKLLAGKPLFQFSLEIARAMTNDDDICVSTDDPNVISLLEKMNYKLPFVRPRELASDTAGTYEVILHAIDFYEKNGKSFDQLILLQPTSPFRKVKHVSEAIHLFSHEMDMVVSVKETKANPYFLLMEENSEGWLEKTKPANFTRRQDAPVVYELNGAVYVMNVKSLKQAPPSSFRRIKKYVMDELTSVDLDTPVDWLIAETFLEKGIVTI